MKDRPFGSSLHGFRRAFIGFVPYCRAPAFPHGADGEDFLVLQGFDGGGEVNGRDASAKGGDSAAIVAGDGAELACVTGRAVLAGACGSWRAVSSFVRSSNLLQSVMPVSTSSRSSRQTV